MLFPYLVLFELLSPRPTRAGQILLALPEGPQDSALQLPGVVPQGPVASTPSPSSATPSSLLLYGILGCWTIITVHPDKVVTADPRRAAPSIRVYQLSRRLKGPGLAGRQVVVRAPRPSRQMMTRPDDDGW